MFIKKLEVNTKLSFKLITLKWLKDYYGFNKLF